MRSALLQRADEPGLRALVLDAESVPFVDITAIRMLEELAEDLRSRSITFAIAHGIGQVRDLLRQGALSGGPQLFPTVADAVAALQAVDRP